MSKSICRNTYFEGEKDTTHTYAVDAANSLFDRLMSEIDVLNCN